MVGLLKYNEPGLVHLINAVKLQFLCGGRPAMAAKWPEIDGFL